MHSLTDTHKKICSICMLLLSAAAMTFVVTDSIRQSGAPASIRSENRGTPPYVIREYKGRIAVFETGKSFPELVFEVPVKSLSTLDQYALTHGVFADNATELNRLIEDYTS